MSQKQEVLRYLQSHKKGITQKEALDKFGASRLADLIWKIKKDVYNVKKETIKVQTRRGYAHVARYFMGI